MIKLRTLILVFCLAHFYYANAQPTHFSLATDFTVVHSLKKNQRYWTVGQTIAGNFHFTGKDGIYTLFTYSGSGKFSNRLTSYARDAGAFPQEIGYINKAQLSYRHLSIGWKHYLKGASDNEENWNLYGYGGFGLMFGKIKNTHSVAIDTAAYIVPVLAGEDKFNRLSVDLGLGFEIHVGGGIFVYFEGRGIIATTGYRSKYLYVNNDAPCTGSANLGIRFLFD